VARERLEPASLERRNDFLQHLANQIRPLGTQPVEVDRKIAESFA
jgi:hypothetical protein